MLLALYPILIGFHVWLAVIELPRWLSYPHIWNQIGNLVPLLVVTVWAALAVVLLSFIFVISLFEAASARLDQRQLVGSTVLGMRRSVDVGAHTRIFNIRMPSIDEKVFRPALAVFGDTRLLVVTDALSGFDSLRDELRRRTAR